MGVVDTDVAPAPVPPPSSQPGLDGESPAPGASREAIIFLAGGGEGWIDQSVHAVGSRIALELDKHAGTARARFRLDANSRQEVFGGDLKTTVATISREDGGDVAPIIDLYRLETVDALTEDYQQRSSLLKAALPLWVVTATAAPSIARRLRHGGAAHGATTSKDRYQLAAALLTTLTLTFYLLTLVWAALETAFPDWFGSVSPRIPQGVVLALTALGLWKSGWVKTLTQFAVDQLCSILYLNDGYRREVLRGRLAALIEHVCEKADVEYSRIVLMGYSFGTLVAIDSLFPSGGKPSPRHAQIGVLVTIGCPFDIVRSFWPRYFTGRQRLGETPAMWVNIYSPVDVLGSNFRDDPNLGPATRGVEFDDGEPALPTNAVYGSGPSAGWRHALTMNGLKAHGLYWEREDDAEVSAFASVIELVYAGSPVLR